MGFIYAIYHLILLYAFYRSFQWVMSVCPFHDCSDHIWQVQQTHKCDTFLRTIFQCEFNGDVSFVIRMTIYGKSGKHTSVIHLWEPFFDVNLMVMSVLWSEWPYMASSANTQVWYIFGNHFLTWIQWWCPFCDQSDHIWQVQQTHKCDTFSRTIFNMNSVVMLVLWSEWIYIASLANTQVSYIFKNHFSTWIKMVMSVSWSKWPYVYWLQCQDQDPR